MNKTKNPYKMSSITWPLFMQSFLGLLMGNVNVIMLSRLSDKAVGAVGVANQIIGMMNIIYTVISMGTAILITQYLGANKDDSAKNVARTSIWLSIIFGVVFSMLLLVFGNVLLKLMNLPNEMVSYGVVYIRIVGGASFLQAGILIFSAILRSFGNTKLSMQVAILMNVINVIGNYFSVFRPFGLPLLGVTGVAISSLLAGLVGILIVGRFTYQKLDVRFDFNELRQLDPAVFRLILKVGGPAAGEYIFYSLSQIAVTYIVTSLGELAINTRIFILNITCYVNIASFSIGQGTQILMGYMKGAKRLDDMHKTCINALYVAVLTNLVLAVLIYIFGRQFIGIYTQDASIIDMGKTILLIDVFLEVGRAFNHTVGNALRGTGDIRYPVYVSILSMWCICVLLSIVFGINLKFGLAGIWIASGLDEWFRGLILLKRWYSRAWVKIQLV